MNQIHSFHIPVMGIGFTLDTPLKIAQYGINSVVSLVDDELMEKLRKSYSQSFKKNYTEISDKISDYRAKRITSYLNFIKEISEGKLAELKSTTEGIKEYFSLTTLKPELESQERMQLGSIDVNIMTKLDKENYENKKQLPVEYNDAHAALRGFAKSQLNTSLILSAGMNPRLYSYIEQFDDFYPDKMGNLKKKIVLKVSDYRSALIQGKFLAKKGIWVSEFRIESGLNCGGHAFGTNGLLMGPILEEFKINRQTIKQEMNKLFIEALKSKNKDIPKSSLTIKYTAQGGVGTAEEHKFLIDYFKLNKVGWGSPFLLVPEATTVDKDTRSKLGKAKEEDLYLSDISPLGVPFHNLRGNTKDLEKEKNIRNKRPGSSCPKKYLAQNKEFTEESICTASRQYQHFKLQELEKTKPEISEELFEEQKNKITEKSCICVGLGTSALINNNLSTRKEGKGVSICPGPNIAYFSKEVKLEEMIGHIYNKNNILSRKDRPHIFLKELDLYITDFKKILKKYKITQDKKLAKQLKRYKDNLLSGIDYYDALLRGQKNHFIKERKEILSSLVNRKTEIVTLNI